MPIASARLHVQEEVGNQAVYGSAAVVGDKHK